jgi:hypothetical protein
MEEGCGIGDENIISCCPINRGTPKSALSFVIRYWSYTEIWLSSRQGCAPIVVGTPGSAPVFNDTQPADSQSAL